MKTEMQKMRDGERYRFDDKEMQASFARAKRLCAKLNNMSSADEGYRELIEELIPGTCFSHSSLAIKSLANGAI